MGQFHSTVMLDYEVIFHLSSPVYGVSDSPFLEESVTFQHLLYNFVKICIFEIFSTLLKVVM
jgi:hypothetical protein